MYTAAVLGASGYAGGELVRFLDAHRGFSVELLGAKTKAGQRLGSVHPQLGGGDRLLESYDAAALSAVDVVFMALPHGASAAPAMELLEAGVKIVDLGSDFRLDSNNRYLEAYGVVHPFPDQLGAWAYGIPELFSQDRFPSCSPRTSRLLTALRCRGVTQRRSSSHWPP